MENNNNFLSTFNSITPKPNVFSQQTFMNFMKANKNVHQDTNKLITEDELKKHGKPHDCWIVFNGTVYDITYYLKHHPGGYDHLLEYAGKDITEDFRNIHQWVNIGLILENCKVGNLIIDSK